jgi:methionyl aminopeptidase
MNSSPPNGSPSAPPDGQRGQSEIEGVGDQYSPEAQFDVRQRTWAAAHEIAARMVPGVAEEHASRIASEVLTEAGLRKGWHKIVVRVGPNTLKHFHDPSEPGIVLGDNDIFFVDIGPIFRGSEGDVGLTVCVGDDPDMQAGVTDVRALWDEVRRTWVIDGLSGSALYEFADSTATAMGWNLNLGLAGHRLSDFPHKARYTGTLSSVGFPPTSGLWVLEIHIRHPERRFGAFFEDLLIDDDELQRPPAL